MTNGPYFSEFCTFWQVLSKLQPPVLALVQLICNVKLMEAAVIEMKYDANKAPLGKLTKEQIKAGYEALVDISNLVSGGSGKRDSKALLQACNNFYTRYLILDVVNVLVNIYKNRLICTDLFCFLM